MRVGRRDFTWVFPQLSLLGQTSSESCMRVDESLSSFFDFLVFARCFPASFSSFFDACQTADNPSHYSNLSMIRNIFFFPSSSYGQWLGNRLLLQLSMTLVQLSWPVKPLIDSHQNLNQLKVDESAWEAYSLGVSWPTLKWMQTLYTRYSNFSWKSWSMHEAINSQLCFKYYIQIPQRKLYSRVQYISVKNINNIGGAGIWKKLGACCNRKIFQLISLIILVSQGSISLARGSLMSAGLISTSNFISIQQL